jgi:hypothetical protein
VFRGPWPRARGRRLDWSTRLIMRQASAVSDGMASDAPRKPPFFPGVDREAPTIGPPSQLLGRGGGPTRRPKIQNGFQGFAPLPRRLTTIRIVYRPALKGPERPTEPPEPKASGARDSGQHAIMARDGAVRRH